MQPLQCLPRGVIEKLCYLQVKGWASRWCELTSETFTYTKSKQDLQAGRYKTLRVLDLQQIKVTSANTFEVCIP